jgi:hypothetical protein
MRYDGCDRIPGDSFGYCMLLKGASALKVSLAKK